MSAGVFRFEGDSFGERIASALERIADSLNRLEQPVGLRECAVTLQPSEFVVHAADERAEDATYEGFSEHLPAGAGRDGEFVLPDLRTFDYGDTIPDDVTRVQDPVGNVFVWGDGGFDYETDSDSVFLPRDTSAGGWLSTDFPLTEVQYEQEGDDGFPTYSLSEAAMILADAGIATGQRRLKDLLKNRLGWTDAANNPTSLGAEYLRVVKQSSPNRDAVVQLTVDGVGRLESEFLAGLR